MRRTLTSSFALFTLLWSASPAHAAAAKWVEVKSPHFVVVSNASESQARQTAIQFEQIRALFQEALPLTKNHSGPPVTILAVKDDKSLQELLPEYWEKGHAHPAGMYVSLMNQSYIVLELDAGGDNPYETIYHEYYHSLTLPYVPDIPVWLAEGLADFFGNSSVEGKTAIVGKASPPLLSQLQSGRLIPLDVLFHVDHSSPYYNEDSKVSVFYAESWALVHYLLIGDNQAHKAMLTTYMDALSSGASETDAAAKAFGDLNKLQRTLQDYIQRNSYYQFRFPAPAKIADSDLHARAISEADADAYEGGFTVTRGHFPEGKDTLEHAVQLDPKNALAQQNLALDEYFMGQHSAALESASQAIALDPGDMTTRYLRAYLAYNEAPGAKNPQIEEDLRAAISGNPEFAPPYGLLAVYLTSQDKDLTDALTFSQRAITLEPGNADYHLDEAQVLMRMKNFAAARKALGFARQSASTSHQSLQVEMWAQALDQMEKYSNLDTSGGASDSQAVLGQLRRRNGDAVSEDPGGDISVLEASGTVADVTCTDGLKIQLTTAGGIVKLRNTPGGTVRIQSTSVISPDFSPCSLKGSQIKVRYIADSGDSHSGVLEMLQLVELKQ